MNNYRVNVEFAKFSKKFENVAEPKMETVGNVTMLVVEDRNRTYRFNINNIDYYCVEAER